MQCGLHFNHTLGEHLTNCPVYEWEHGWRAAATPSLFSKATMKTAATYATLDKVDGHADMNAAIDLAKAILRAAKRA